MKMELFKKKIMRGIGEHFRRYAHALRFAIGLHGKYVHAVRLSLTFFDMKSDFFQIPKYLKPDMEIE